MTRWALIGTGGIAANMAKTLQRMPEAEMVAVASRSGERSAAFADHHGIPSSYGTYGGFLGRDDIDVVYVATTHDWHPSNAIAALEAGHPVLCEKPLATNLADAERILTAAKGADVFFMEAMWMRFIPVIVKAKQLADEGRIGTVNTVDASFTIAKDFDPDHRLVNPKLAGGTILDIGIYPLNVAHLFLGAPESFTATGRLDRGIDTHADVTAVHPRGFSHSISSLIADLPNEAVVGGADGRIRVHRPHHHSTRLTIERGDAGVVETIDLPYESTGLQFQVEEVHRCLAAGARESSVVPHSTSREMMQWMDAILDRLGVDYPDFGH